MIGENRQLVTNGRVELEKSPNLIKENPKDVDL
jgi:hypothetical protein